MMKEPKILILDIETAPIIAYVWKIWEENIGLEQIKSDWHLLSFAAKWHGDPANKIIYMDQRNAKSIEDDRPLLKKLWELIDSADILLTHNGIKFDIKKIKSRFILNGFKPPANIKHIDTYKLAKKHFGFTSGKLEYLTDKLCTKYKKTKHKKFPGFVLWKECLAGNKDAWKEMEQYNKYDILSLEELYNKISPWDTSFNVNLYRDDLEVVCNCGSNDLQQRGFAFTKIGKYQRYQCKNCGSWTRGRYNTLFAEKRQTLRI
ncbi:MAG: ribonuclease H-like domain-containing protein [bacterium]|nr:ribonuclease H-like domain-containing protein [bacterium]